MDNNVLQTTTKNVLDTIKKHPETKEILESLFPTLVDNNPYCKIGVVFKRENYNCHYALFKQGGIVRFINITNNKYFNADRQIKTIYLADETAESVTLGEFKAIVGNIWNQFLPIPLK